MEWEKKDEEKGTGQPITRLMEARRAIFCTTERTAAMI